MTKGCVLVTGGLGCIGAETTKWLLANTNFDVVVCSRSITSERTRDVFDGIDLQRVEFGEVDVRDRGNLLRLLQEFEITHVVHLAGLQTPDCNQHRDLGLQINLAGTQNLIEASKELGKTLDRFVFASSVAVYGPRDAYPPGMVAMDVVPQPVNVYGAWKLAGENIARIFAEETGTPTISLRPGALFGPGRDLGLTASPTTAMKHVARCTSYEIPYSNKQDYLYSPDVGAAFGAAISQPFQGYGVFTLPSHTVDSFKLVEAMRSAAQELGISESIDISIGSEVVPFVCEIDFQPFVRTFSNVSHTPLQQAVTESIAHFHRVGV